MTIHESGEMYLETILILSQKMDHVRSIDVVEHMGFSKPSISRGMKLLRGQKLIEVDGAGYLTLTQEGRRIAEKIYERHTFLSTFIAKLGVNPQTAAEDACKMEHVISDETFEALKRHIAAAEKKG
ncbi:MAG: metal-dependent transcriptional regulator [Clostridia bacterium]|nr:metal-dependent transcriptional regulator [Clostridia bacterium]